MSAAPELSLDELSVSGVAGAKARSARPSLRVVAARQPRLGRNAFGLVVGAMLLMGLLAVLLLNTLLAQGAFAIHALELKSTELDISHQELAGEVAALDTPAALETRARALGMVQVTNPVFLRLHGHRVLGKPGVAQAPVKPAPVVEPAPVVKLGQAGKPAATKPTAVPPVATGDGAVATAVTKP